MQRRENTFRIDYAKIPKKPSYEELHHFVGSVLGMKRDEVIRLQCSRFLSCAFVKASSLSVAERVVSEHDGKHEMEVDKKMYPLRLWMEDGGVDVKLHDLSEDVQDDTIVDFMKEYGDVISIRELYWDSKFQFGTISTGVRVVRMVVKKNIPTIVTLDTETTCVSYVGQLQTCRHCNEQVHNGITCIQNKKLLLQKLHADKSSYVSVVKQSTMSKDTSHKTSNNMPRRTLTKATAGQQVTNPRNANSPSPPTSSTNPNDLMPPPPLSTLTVPATHAESDFPPLRHKQHPATNEQRYADENDTDSSTTSTNSRRLRNRPPGKKMRTNDELNLNDEQ